MKKLKQTLKKFFLRFERAILLIAGAAGLTALLLNLDFNLLESNLYDLRMSAGAQPRADQDIVLVTLDDETTKSLDDFAPLPLDAHARFLESLERLSPKGVGYLVDMNHVNQVSPEAFAGPWGQRFVEAAHRLQSKGTVLLLGTPYDVTGEVLPPYPLSSLPHSIAVIHKDGNVFSDDKVTRRALLTMNDKPTFHLELAHALGWASPLSSPRGSFEVPETDGKYFFFRYHGSPATEKLPYPRVSFMEVLNHQLPDGAFRGKTLLVGTLSREDSSDFTFTPFSRAPFANPKLAIHAMILDTIANDRGIERAPTAVNWLITFVVTGFVLWWVLNSTPLYGVFLTLGLSVAFLGLAQVLFQWKGIWIRESQPLVGIFMGYYLAVPYRLIREYKKRWDYQRKNELLTQVEELKTNFLSLVTHDLKTPVARIQGLAELILRKTEAADARAETLKHIISSTEELNRFISSILELSKVESDQMQLKFESKDVNQLIERLIEGFSAQARAKKIALVATLEPLFPIHVDAALISKVLSNLIDNAIKYSPPGSTVTVESREVGASVEISIRDQGIGMSPEERDNLFTRFYRAKNATTAENPGTGLGLYLTRYFIEAHQGQVSVETERGQGSTFKVILPIAPPVFAAQSGLTRKSTDQPQRERAGE